MLVGQPLLGLSGFFDRDSFTETLAGWARTVVCGRARLGGLPCGVVAVETRMVAKLSPADPANAESSHVSAKQAGQVWYPDSAYKTAQAIRDFNHGEQLPLFIFANWRGFSGGMRDMFDEVLKFGSFIVDALREFRQPVFVYIPPGGELRGGAWVVLDPSINQEHMEMYADPNSRGGVLEASGTVEIKYRLPQLQATMHRLDSVCLKLKTQLQTPGADEKDLREQLRERESLLLPVYQQAAVQFADLHDTPARMKAKGVIREVVPWPQARRFFFLRLKRRLLEFAVARKLGESAPTPALLQAVFPAAPPAAWQDDSAAIRVLDASDAALQTFVDTRDRARAQADLRALKAKYPDLFAAVAK
jgi:acetyl-CoA carboxylase/biotin carboxylase 1